MPDLDQASARLLETTFRQVFSEAPYFRDAICNQTLWLFTQNTDLPEDPDLIRIPCLIFSARVTGDFRKVKQNGRWADMAELSLECRVDGTPALSSFEIESMHTNVRNVVERGAYGIQGWFYLNWWAPTEETAFEHGSRIKKAIYPMPCMSLAAAGLL